MKKMLHKFLGLQLPTSDQIVNNQLRQIHQNNMAMMQQEAAQQEESLPEGTLAKVSVYLFRDNNCKLIIEIDDKASTNEEASAIGRMLFSLNEGEMKPTFVSSLMRNSTEDIQCTDFYNKVTTAWQNQYKEHDSDVILPSQAMAGGSNEAIS